MAAPTSLCVALFVEGSAHVSSRRGDAFERLWKQALVTALGLRRVDHVFPISKKHLIAMDPTTPRMSGAGEPLDQLMSRKLASNPFDAAVIAWDLQPIWAQVSPSACRWKEVLELYRRLGSSMYLPSGWSSWAARKNNELLARAVPSARSAVSRLERFATLAVCMEPVFEGLLVASENGLRRALGVEGRKLKSWPTRWRDPGVRRPEIDLLQAALCAARSVDPPPVAAFKIRGDLWTTKHEWGEYLVRTLFRDPKAREELETHCLARRLREILS